MRYIGRTHGVSIAWLRERFKEPHLLMTYCESSKQAGDIYTKPFIDASKWEGVCDLIGVFHPSRLHALIRHFVGAYGKLSLKPKVSASDDEDLAAPATSSWGDCAESCVSAGGGSSTSAAGTSERGSGSLSPAVKWSGSHGNVHGKPRQTHLDKLHGRKAYLVKDEWAKTICEMIDKVAWPKQSAEDGRSGYGLTIGLCGEFCVGDPRALNGKIKEVVRAINSALVECLPKTFEWTSLQIDIDSVVSDQCNSQQVGQVACLLLGDFSGGCFH